jgi:hypothetical protein
VSCELAEAALAGGPQTRAATHRPPRRLRPIPTGRSPTGYASWRWCPDGLARHSAAGSAAAALCSARLAAFPPFGLARFTGLPGGGMNPSRLPRRGSGRPRGVSGGPQGMKRSRFADDEYAARRQGAAAENRKPRSLPVSTRVLHPPSARTAKRLLFSRDTPLASPALRHLANPPLRSIGALWRPKRE